MINSKEAFQLGLQLIPDPTAQGIGNHCHDLLLQIGIGINLGVDGFGALIHQIIKGSRQGAYRFAGQERLFDAMTTACQRRGQVARLREFRSNLRVNLLTYSMEFLMKL